MTRHARAALAGLLLLAGCGKDASSPLEPDVLGPEPGGPSLEISDAARGSEVPGFYFLIPTVLNHPSFAGQFDASLNPRIEICELSGSACTGAPIEVMTRSGGQIAVLFNSSYNAIWSTYAENLDPNKFYRATVSVDGFELGFVDIDVVARLSHLAQVDTTEYAPLINKLPFILRFRIEEGIARSVDVEPDAATVAVGGTQQFSATVTDLHGNLIASPSVTWTSSDATVATVDANGLATGVSPGVVTVTAKSQGASGTATLTVESTNTPPVAADDAFEAIGNVTIPVSAPGVLANDSDAEGGLQAVPGTFPTTGGGSVTLAADGSFTYLSAAGFTGVDGFSYQATDGTATSAPATVTITVAERVWYVENDASAPGDGRDASPFTTLAQAEAASSAGETIFVGTGDGTAAGQDAGIELKAGQSLIGQGISDDTTATVNGEEIVLLAAGAAPSVANTGAPAVELATGNTVRGFLLTSSNAPAIAGSGFGSFTASDLSATSAGSAVVTLQGGALDATFRSLSSFGGATGISLTSTTGSFTVTGTGAAGTGGAIQGAAGAGVTLAAASDVSLAFMLIDGNLGGGIVGTGSVNGFALISSTVSENGDAAGERAIELNEVRGTASITGSSVSGSAHENVYVRNTAAGVNDRLVITGSTISDASNAAGSDAVFVHLLGTADFETVVQSSSVSGATTECLQVLVEGSAESSLTVTGSSFSGCSSAINLAGSGGSASEVEITANLQVEATVGSGINLVVGGTSTLRGTVSGNVVSSGSPSNNGIGIDAIADGEAVAVLAITDNQVSGFSIALRGAAREEGATADLTIADNVLAAGGNFELSAVYLASGNGTSGEANRLCVDLSNNQATVTQPFNLDYWLEQWAGNEFELEGFAGDGTDEVTVEAFVSSRDVDGASVEAFGGAVVEFSGGTCATP